MSQETFTHQLILSNVPTRDGNHKTLTFIKCSSDPTLRYYDVFEYMEQETGIPRFYFTMRNNKTTVRYTDIFAQRELYKLAFTPKAPMDMFSVNVDIYATHKLFNIHKTIVRNISRPASKLYALGSMMEFVKKYIYKTPIMIEYCVYFTKHPDFIKELSMEDKHFLMNGVDNIIRQTHDETRYIYEEDTDEKTYANVRKMLDEMEQNKTRVFRSLSSC